MWNFWKKIREQLRRRYENEVFFPDIGPEHVQFILDRRFAGKDPRRFYRLWSEIAFYVNRLPTELHEDDVIVDLCNGPNGPAFQGIESMVGERCRIKALPEDDLRTVGALMDWLLDDDTSAGDGEAK
jgi:hypothetical protein